MSNATCRLVNMFGDIALEATQLDQADLLRELLIQIKILNVHMQKLSDENVRIDDVINNGEHQ